MLATWGIPAIFLVDKLVADIWNTLTRCIGEVKFCSTFSVFDGKVVVRLQHCPTNVQSCIKVDATASKLQRCSNVTLTLKSCLTS